MAALTSDWLRHQVISNVSLGILKKCSSFWSSLKSKMATLASDLTRHLLLLYPEKTTSRLVEMFVKGSLISSFNQKYHFQFLLYIFWSSINFLCQKTLFWLNHHMTYSFEQREITLLDICDYFWKKVFIAENNARNQYIQIYVN